MGGTGGCPIGGSQEGGGCTHMGHMGLRIPGGSRTVNMDDGEVTLRGRGGTRQAPTVVHKFPSG